MFRTLVFLTVCAVAAVRPFWIPATQCDVDSGIFSGWPTHFEEMPLTPLDLSPREERFMAEFPGRMAKFRCGRRIVLMRWVTRATRKLHPASDCFRGKGYSIRPLSLSLDRHGKRWGRFSGRRDTTRILVKERISDSSGRGWTDMSSWYWKALLGSTRGPWWAITVVETELTQ